MANRERGEVSIEVGGKAYTLRPTFDAMCEFEDLTGKTVDDLFEDVLKNKLSGMRAVVWCLLHDAHAEEIKTLKDASRWVDRAGIDAVRDAVERALGLNQAPAPTQGGAEAPANPPDAQAGTGEPSSSTLVGSV
jgi:hypothetical protein